MIGYALSMADVAQAVPGAKKSGLPKQPAKRKEHRMTDAPFTEKDNPQEAKAHTPGPWHVMEGAKHRADDTPEETRWTISGPTPQGPLVAVSPRFQGPDAKRAVYQANAAFIVRACNSHEELLEIADDAMKMLADLRAYASFREMAEKVIKEARGS